MGIPAGTTRITMSGHLATVEKWACSWYQTGHVISDDLDIAASTMVSSVPFTTFLSSFRPFLAGDDTFDQVDMYFYDGGTAAVRHGSASVGSTGLGGTGVPKQNAAVITERTALTSRSGRGRMYLPATGGVYVAGGRLDSTKLNPLVDNLAALFTAQVAIALIPCVVSQTHTSSMPIKSLDADTIADTQRGRRGKFTGARHSHTI